MAAMTQGKTSQRVPMTLSQAHEDAARRRPERDASLTAWQRFHRENMEMYRVVSDVDRFHHHEALYWVGHELRLADVVAEMIRKGVVS
jgi:antirestriction protein ArdC